MTATERLDQIDARTNAATEGRWEPVRDDHGRKGIEHSVWAGDMTGRYVAEWIRNEGDAVFIAAARQDVPDLTRTIRAILDVIDDQGTQGFDDTEAMVRIFRAIESGLGARE